MRPGAYAAHSSSTQSFHARTQASASSGSSVSCWSRWPANPGRNDGKHTDAYTPLTSMSAMRARDVPRAAAHLVEAGRFEAVLADRPADDRVEADVRQLLPLEDPGLAAVVALDDARRARRRTSPGSRPSNASGGSTMWSSTEITVYRRSARSGSGSHVTSPAVRGGESLLRLQLLERDRHGYSNTSGSSRDERAHDAVPVHGRGPFDQRRLQLLLVRRRDRDGRAVHRPHEPVRACTCARTAPTCRPPPRSSAR